MDLKMHLNITCIAIELGALIFTVALSGGEYWLKIKGLRTEPGGMPDISPQLALTHDNIVASQKTSRFKVDQSLSGAKFQILRKPENAAVHIVFKL